MKVVPLEDKITDRLTKPLILYAKGGFNRNFRRKPLQKETVFVSGVHRSGTNMIMKFLNKSLLCEVFMESDKRAFDNYMMRDKETISALIRDSGCRVVIVKALHEAHLLGELLNDFGPAKAIWMYRDYNDVVNSITTRWPQNRNSYDKIVEALDNSDWRCGGIAEATLARIRQNYDPDDNNATANAWFWYWRNMIFFDLNFHENRNVILVKYDDFVKNSDRIGNLICNFLGITLTSSMTRVPNTNSIKKSPQQSISPACLEACHEMQTWLDRVWMQTLT